MVVQIVPEGVDEVDGVVSGVGVGVSGEQHWREISSKHFRSFSKTSFENTTWFLFLATLIASG